jgi:hypothetical protein
MKLLCFTINFVQLHPDASYSVRVPSHVMKWNNVVAYRGQVLAAIYDEAVAKYKDNRTAAETAYRLHLDNCKSLDNEVTVLDAGCRETADSWKSFVKSYIKMAVLRHVLLVHHNHDSFAMASKQAMNVQRTPSARRQHARCVKCPRSICKIPWISKMHMVVYLRKVELVTA